MCVRRVWSIVVERHHQIDELDMTFDAIACYQQLMLAAGKKDFPPVPNTLENALKDETTRIVVTTAAVRTAYRQRDANPLLSSR